MVGRHPGTREPAVVVKGSTSRSILAVQRRRRTERRATSHQQAEIAGRLDFHHAPARCSRTLQPTRRRGHDPMKALLPRYVAALDTYTTAHS